MNALDNKDVIGRSITKTIDLRVRPERAFEFLADPLNRPKWAIVNMKSVKPGGTDGWHETETRHGKGQLKMLPNAALGILDHLWKDPQAAWAVPARIVPNGEGSTFMMTFFQPPGMSAETFDAAAKELDIEFKKLKEVLEHESRKLKVTNRRTL